MMLNKIFLCCSFLTFIANTEDIPSPNVMCDFPYKLQTCDFDRKLCFVYIPETNCSWRFILLGFTLIYFLQLKHSLKKQIKTLHLRHLPVFSVVLFFSTTSREYRGIRSKKNILQAITHFIIIHAFRNLVSVLKMHDCCSRISKNFNSWTLRGDL